MRIIITGRSNSGKSTAMSFLQKDQSAIEVSPDKILANYSEEDIIILIDTPALFCYKRSGCIENDIDYLNRIKKEDFLLDFVKELPDCHILKNDQSTDVLKVRLKRLIKSL